MSKNYRFVWVVVAIAVMAIRLGPTSADDKPAPRFEITPKVWLVGDPKLDIRVVNLKPNQKVTVVSQTDKVVSRRIDGVADAKGQFDLRGTHEPGPKTGAPFRVLWDAKEDPSIEPMKEPGIHFRAEVDGKTIATGRLQHNYGRVEDPKVTVEKVNERGLHGEIALPPGPGPFPAVLIFGGSEGGLSQSGKATILAKHGFACLTVAYFDTKGVAGLPNQLIEVPLETFESAIAWLKEQKQVRGDRIAVMGGSRGGEVALLLGSMFPEVKAVVAYAPSHVVWGGWPIADEDRKKKMNRPAWTYKGKPVPFISRALTEVEEKKLTEKDPFDRRPLYVEWLKDKDMVRDATIPVEKIAGPILMITGTEDRTWPAAEMADEVMKRLAEKKHPFPRRLLSYDGCGHFIGMPLRPPGVAPHLGGSVEANSYAAWDSWPKVVKFLHDSLK